MPTYEEVMQALRNADAAGDVEAATRLAQIASQMQQQKPLSAGDVAVGAVRNFPESAMNLVSDLATAVTSPIQTAKKRIRPWCGHFTSCFTRGYCSGRG
jgi:hypothetical protein